MLAEAAQLANQYITVLFSILSTANGVLVLGSGFSGTGIMAELLDKLVALLRRDVEYSKYTRTLLSVISDYE